MMGVSAATLAVRHIQVRLDPLERFALALAWAWARHERAGPGMPCARARLRGRCARLRCIALKRRLQPRLLYRRTGDRCSRSAQLWSASSCCSPFTHALHPHVRGSSPLAELAAAGQARGGPSACECLVEAASHLVCSSPSCAAREVAQGDLSRLALFRRARHRHRHPVPVERPLSSRLFLDGRLRRPRRGFFFVFGRRRGGGTPPDADRCEPTCSAPPAQTLGVFGA